MTTRPLTKSGRWEPNRKLTANRPQNAVFFQRFGLVASRALRTEMAAKKAPPKDPNWAGQKFVYELSMQPVYAWQSVAAPKPAKKK